MRTPMRIGVVGCGWGARNLHLPALARIEEARVVGVASRSRASAEAVARTFGIPRAFDGAGELLADDSVDVVCVATPPIAHAELTLAALDAGKHVLVEKPLAISLDECDAMVERAEDAGVRATVGFNMRWYPQVRRSRALLRSGRIGEPRMLGSTFSGDQAGPERADWRHDPAQGGGPLLRAAPHHTDLWRFLLDEEVTRVGCFMPPSAKVAALIAETEGGVTIATEVSDSAGPTNQVRVHGSAGRLTASLYRFDGLELLDTRATGGEPRARLRRGAFGVRAVAGALADLRHGGAFLGTFEAMWRDFLAAARDDRAVECSLADGRETTRILLAALDSAARGEAVRVDAAPRVPPPATPVGRPASL